MALCLEASALSQVEWIDALAFTLQGRSRQDVSRTAMALLRPFRFDKLALLMLATELLSAPAFGQPPRDGCYTYCWGYNPGYYGSSICPQDPGAKLGQASVPMHSLYRYIPRRPPAAAQNQTRLQNPQFGQIKRGF
jgi:hypothetical protein